MQRFLTILQNYLNQIHMPNLRWTDIVEILILAFLIYHILLWIKNTRAWSLLKGIEGIQAYEKIRILREEFTATGNTAKLAELDALQEKFNFNSQYTDDFPTLIHQGQEELNAF